MNGTVTSENAQDFAYPKNKQEKRNEANTIAALNNTNWGEEESETISEHRQKILTM